MQTETGLTNRKRTRSDRGFWTGPIGWNVAVGPIAGSAAGCARPHQAARGDLRPDGGAVPALRRVGTVLSRQNLVADRLRHPRAYLAGSLFVPALRR